MKELFTFFPAYYAEINHKASQKTTRQLSSPFSKSMLWESLGFCPI